MGRAAALADLGVDGSRDVVAGRELGRAAVVGLASVRERIDPLAGLLVGTGVLVAPVVGEVAPHEALAIGVAEDAALPSHGLGHQEASHAGGPHHAGRVELDELHVDELGTRPIGQSVPVRGVLPRVRGHRPGPPDAAGREDGRGGREGDRTPILATVPEGPDDAIVMGREPRDRRLHVDLHAGPDRAVLERPDHLEARSVADVGEARMGVTAEGALEDAPVARAVEHGAPVLQLAHAIGCLPGMELGHARVVEHPPAHHRVAEVGLPRVTVIDVGERRRDAALGHDRVGLAQQRFAGDAHRRSCLSRGDGGAEAGPAGPDDEDVVLMGLDGRHAGGDAFGQNVMAGSLMSPRPSARTYMSAATTEMRLAHAHTEWRTLRMVTFSHIVCRVRACRVHEKQSSLPPVRWRSELHPRVKNASSTTFVPSTTDPRPIRHWSS